MSKSFQQMSLSKFTEQELSNLKRLSRSIRENKISRRMHEILSQPFYQEMSDSERHQWLNSQVIEINSKSKVNGLVLFVGFVVSTALGFQIGGFLGFVVFLVGLGVSSSAATKKSSDSILVPFYTDKIDELAPLIKEQERRKQEELDEARKEEERVLQLEVNEKRKKAQGKSQELFNAMKKDPSLISECFEQYKEATALEMSCFSPGQEHIDKNVAAKEFVNGVLIGGLGVWTKGYIPANDQKFQNLINILSREKKRVRELADVARLPFIVIDYYQEVSRSYYGLHREGGNATIYDEQLITNEVMAIKESLVVHGDYHDKSMRLDRSVTNMTHVQNAVIDNGKYDDEKIKKEVLKFILSSEHETASRLELMAIIPVKESRLLAVLEDLQQSGVLQIGNRDSGEIVYKIDRLA